MTRWAIMCVGAAVFGLAIWVVVRDFHPPHPIGRDPRAPVDGGALEDALAGDARTDGGSDAGLLLIGDLAAEALPPFSVPGRFDGGPGALLPDGSPVPALPATAPRQVRFGVVLVAYAGGQRVPGAPSGARPPTRSRAEAKALAEKLVVAAGQDFHAAVADGDVGSADDLGRVKLGVLEPAPEYVLFTLAVGAVGGPVDTPRGYWIIKRLE